MNSRPRAPARFDVGARLREVRERTGLSQRALAQRAAVPHGQIKFVLYDDRVDSSTRGELQEIFLGPDNYCLVTVPPLVWNGFKGVGTEMAVVANCASIPHDPAEIERKDPFDPSIPYDWALKHR